MEGLDFLLAMEDGVSKSALAGSAALEELHKNAEQAQAAVGKAFQSGNANDLTGALKNLNVAQGNVANANKSLGIQSAGEQAKQAAKSQDELVSSVTEFVGVAGQAIGIAVAFAGALATLTLAGAKLSIDAADFKGDMEDAYASALGTADEGARTYGEVDKIAQSLTAPIEATHERAVALLNTGLAKDQMESTLQALGDLEATGGKFGLQAAAKVQSIVEQATTSGSFEINKRKLSGTGVQLETLYEEIGKRVGVGTKQVEAMMKAGQIKAEVGIDALNAAIENKYAGNAEKNAKDLSVQITHAYSNFTKLFEDVDSAPFLDKLSELGSMLRADSAVGGAFKTMITGAFTAFYDVAEAVLPYVAQGLQYITIGVLRGYIAMGPMLVAFKEWFQAHDDNGESTKEFWEFVSNSIAATGTALGYVGTGILAAFDALIAVKDQVSSAFTMMQQGWEGIKSTVAAIFANPGQIASDFVNGLIEGIKNKAADLLSTVANLGQSVIDSVKSKLGIKSPSTVMYEVGAYTGEGMAGGLEDSATLVQSQMSALATPPAPANSNSMSAGGINVYITIEGGGKDAESLAEEIASRLSSELEHYRLQLGIAA